MRYQTLTFLFCAALGLASCSSSKQTSECVEETYVHPYGVRVKPDYWTERGKNGQIITTTRDGIKISQTFCNGKLHGKCCYTFPHSDHFEKIEIYDSNRVVQQQIFDTLGNAKQLCEWTSPACTTITCWYPCGNLRSKENFVDGRLIQGDYYNTKNHRDSWVYAGEGERYTRDENGHFICTDIYAGGELKRRTYYYPNKSPCEVVSYSGQVPHGERKTFYPDGSPCSTEQWENGKLHGLTTIYQDGERYAEVPYVAGKKQGIEKRYSDGYHVSQEVTWDDNQMCGPTYTYAGESVQTDWFYKGRITSRANFESYGTPQD